MPSNRLAGLVLAALLVSSPLHAACGFGTLTPVRYPAGDQAGDVVAGRFNADAYIDLAILNRGSQATISVLLGAAGGTFLPRTTIPLGYTYGDLMTGDITGDGKLDLAVAMPWTPDLQGKPYVRTLRGKGDGTFTAVAFTDQMLIWQNPEWFATGDFNSDGRMDAVVTKGNGELSALQAVPNGFLVQKAEYTTLQAGETGGWATSAVTGHFDGDGLLDVAVSESIHRRVVPFFGVGDGTFVKGTAIPVAVADPDDHPWSLGAGDVNGDGYDDLAIGMRDQSYGPDFPSTFLATSNGASRTFDAPVQIIESLTSSIEKVSVVDMDGDGKLDLVLGTPWSMHVYFGDGLGAFPTNTTIPDDHALGMVITDIDRDGGPDIVSTSFSAGEALVALNLCGRVSLDLTSSADPASQGVNFTLTATTMAPPTAVPTGTLTIARNATPLATGNLPTVSATTSQPLPGIYEYTAHYSGDSRFAPAATTLLLAVQPPPFGPPPGFSALSFGGPVELSWIATRGVHHYEIWRSTGGAFVLAGSSTTASFTDRSAPASSSFLYKVRGISATGAASDFSAPDLTTTQSFTDELLQASVTVIKAAHLLELRTSVNGARMAAGLPPASFTAMDIVRAAHITELRAAIQEARGAIGLPAVTFTDPVLTPGASPIHPSHFLQLRSAIR